MSESETSFTFSQITTERLAALPGVDKNTVSELCVRTLVMMTRRDGWSPSRDDGRLDEEVGQALTDKVEQCDEACPLVIAVSGLQMVYEAYEMVEVTAQCEDVAVGDLDGIQPTLDGCRSHQEMILGGLDSALSERKDELSEYS